MTYSIYMKQRWDKFSADEKYWDQWISDEIWFLAMKACHQEIDTFYQGGFTRKNNNGHLVFLMGRLCKYSGQVTQAGYFPGSIIGFYLRSEEYHMVTTQWGDGSVP